MCTFNTNDNKSVTFIYVVVDRFYEMKNKSHFMKTKMIFAGFSQRNSNEDLYGGVFTSLCLFGLYYANILEKKSV